MLAPTDRQIGAKQFIISIALANLESLLVMIYNFVLHKGGYCVEFDTGQVTHGIREPDK